VLSNPLGALLYCPGWCRPSPATVLLKQASDFGVTTLVKYTQTLSVASSLQRSATENARQTWYCQVSPALPADRMVSGHTACLQQIVRMLNSLIVEYLCLFLLVRGSCAWQPPKAASICPVANSRASHANTEKTATMAVSFLCLDQRAPGWCLSILQKGPAHVQNASAGEQLGAVRREDESCWMFGSSNCCV
jgi:hypothetical protein